MNKEKKRKQIARVCVCFIEIWIRRITKIDNVLTLVTLCRHQGTVKYRLPNNNNQNKNSSSISKRQSAVDDVCVCECVKSVNTNTSQRHLNDSLFFSTKH